MAHRRRKPRPDPPTALVIAGPYLGAKIHLSSYSRVTGCFCVADGDIAGRWVALAPGQFRAVRAAVGEATWRRRIEVMA